MPSPGVVALAGPNGAGKSTTGPPLLKETLGVTQFVNADLIAEGLAAFDPAGVALKAGKVMLSRIKELADSRTTLAFETTLAGRSYSGTPPPRLVAAGRGRDATLIEDATTWSQLTKLYGDRPNAD